MTPSLDDLDDTFRSMASAFINELRRKGIPFVVTSVMRPQAVQMAYYAQGRLLLDEVNRLRRLAGLPLINDKENLYTVTKLDGVKNQSMHQKGLAIDVVPATAGKASWPPAGDPRWEILGRIGEECGLDWGGRWKDFIDLPHYQRKA